MLVLTRREAEKILFPSLGISVEVTRVQGKTVRLGIHAPREIRIIRGELATDEDVDVIAKPDTDRFGNNGGSVQRSNSDREIRRNLDAANLAIHLAQNQLRQRMADRAEEALTHALDCLEKLAVAISLDSARQPNERTVHEARSGYQRSSKRIALVVHTDDQDLDGQRSDCLTQQGLLSA